MRGKGLSRGEVPSMDGSRTKRKRNDDDDDHDDTALVRSSSSKHSRSLSPLLRPWCRGEREQQLEGRRERKRKARVLSFFSFQNAKREREREMGFEIDLFSLCFFFSFDVVDDDVVVKAKASSFFAPNDSSSLPRLSGSLSFARLRQIKGVSAVSPWR